MDDTAATDAANPSRKKRSPKGRDELNLATIPLSVLTHQQPTDTERKQKHYSRSFTYTVWADQLGRWLPAKVTLRSNPEDGLPTPADESLFLALFNIAYDAGLARGDRLEFIPNQLFELMGLKRNSYNYTRLEKQLDRLTAVKVICEYAWFDVQNHDYKAKKTFGLLADAELHRPRQSRDRGLPKRQKADVVGKNINSYVVFDPEIYRQLISGTLKPLDLAFYFSLKLPTSRRIYRTLDRYFYRRNSYSADLRNFAHGNLGMSDQLNTGQIKRNLEPSIHELVLRNFIQPADRSDRYTKVKKGIWRINFEKTPRHKTTSKSKAVGDTATDPLTTQLIDRGITKSVATTLVKQFPADRITKHLEVFDWYNAKRGEQKKPGWLRTAIQDDYTTPDGYTTKADRDAKAKVIQQQHEALAKKARAEKERSEREATERQQLQATWQPVWENLSSDERGQIEQQVFDSKFPNITAHRQRQQIRSSHIFMLDCLRHLQNHPPAIVAGK